MTRAAQPARIDRIGLQVSRLHPGRALLSLIAGVLWLAGFVAGLLLLLVITVLWTIPAWCVVAVRLGAHDALSDRTPFRRNNQ